MSPQPEVAFDPNIPSGAAYALRPVSPRRAMQTRIAAIIKDHQHELLDAVNLDDANQARERIACAIVDELP